MIIIGDMRIDNSGIPEISDFTFDEEDIREYAEQSVKIKFNRTEFYKIIGLWDWVVMNCPNKRVVYLMTYGKNKRIRNKNFNRAVRIIGKMLDRKDRKE